MTTSTEHTPPKPARMSPFAISEEERLELLASLILEAIMQEQAEKE